MYRKKRKICKHVMELFAVCFSIFSDVVMVNCDVSKCEKASTLPIIGICSGSNKIIEGAHVLIDGFNVYNNSTVKRCTCVAKAVFESATRIDYIDMLQPSPLQRNCGSSIVFSQSLSASAPRVQSCVVNGSMNINVTQDIYITLEKESPLSDTRYCFSVTIDQGNRIIVMCNRTEFMNYTLEVQNYHKTESSENLYIGIGVGVFGMLLIVIVGIYLVKQFRAKKEQSRQDNETHEDNDEYGLQYNTLYVSSNDVPNNHTETSKSSTSRQDENVTYQVDGNYSEISLDDIPSDSVGSVSTEYMNERGKYGITIDGDYAAIDMDENAASALHGDIKSQLNESRVDDDGSHVIGDPDIEHVISPGENGCEYAIVQKDKNIDDQDNVYAVVDKTRKRNE